ncbi:STAS domain-containing protein [Streptomyces virginiae]|uniref:STAS domain-containing protein n=1 Tax=Streptomyces virginiae TaxID=1961 RepID=UPI0036A665EB
METTRKDVPQVADVVLADANRPAPGPVREARDRPRDRAAVAALRRTVARAGVLPGAQSEGENRGSAVEEASVVARPHPTGQVSVSVCDGAAVLRFTGEVTAETALLLEDRLRDPILQESGVWILDMTGLARVDLTCAFALRRAIIRRPGTTSVRILNARRAVERTLRRGGADVKGTSFVWSASPPVTASGGSRGEESRIGQPGSPTA